MWNQSVHAKDIAPLQTWQGLHILPGLNAVTGDEDSGKTRLLRELSEAMPDAVWADLRLPGQDESTAEAVWAQWQTRWTGWNTGLQNDLSDALQLRQHQGKPLFMLSTGSRRKVALVGLLSCGARITCIDQPYAALDLPSAQVIRMFLAEASDHPTRAWLVADYEADPALPWANQITLPRA